MKRFNKITCARKYLQWVISHPLYVILPLSIITILFAWQLPGLQFRTSIYDLSVEDLPETALYKAFKEEFGPDDTILVVVRGRNMFAPDVFADLTGLSEGLSEIQGISRVIALPEIKRYMDITGLWSLEDFKEAMRPLAIFQKSLISMDGQTTIISLLLEENADRDRVVEEVERLIEKEKGEGLESYQVGIPVVARALAEYTEKDFLRLPPIVALVIVAVLFTLFRNLLGILIPVGFVFISLIWTFGLMAWTGTPLSMLSILVPIFVIGVGSAYCMYVLSEYFRSLGKIRSPRNAAQVCLLRTGFPTTLAVVTTTIGLGSLLLQRIHAIREFALFSCFGTWSILILLLLLLPAVLGRLALPEGMRGRWPFPEGPFDRFLSMVAGIILHRRRIIFLLFGLITLFGIIGMTKIRSETDPVRYFGEKTSIRENLARTRGEIAGCFPLNVVLNGNRTQYFDEPKNLKIIQDLQQFLDSLEGVDKTISFADYLSLANYVTHQYQTRYYGLPKEASEVRRLVRILQAMVGKDLLEKFANEDRSMANILLRTHASSSGDILRIRARIMAHLGQTLQPGADCQVTGFGTMISESSRVLTRAQVQSLLLTLGLISGVMFLLFMSIRVGLIALIPNCFPIVVNFGLMGWLGIELSVGTCLVACIAIGLAVDDTIHFLVRYHRELKKTRDKEKALVNTIGCIGRPIIFTTLTVGVGFSLLLLSHFQPTALFGLLIVVTMFSALLGDLILLPSLLMRVRHHFAPSVL